MTAEHNATLSERGPQFFTDGPITVAIGGEAAITRWEILGHMTAGRLSVDSVAHGLTLLGLNGDFADDAVVSVFIDDAEDPLVFAHIEPEIPARRVLIAEAMAAVWNNRIQDIADTSAPLYQDAVEDLGRLEIPGSPHLNELLAQRRRSTTTDRVEIEALSHLVHELRQAVVFGAAGFLAADPAELKDTTRKALAPDGWIHRLSLLVAAEECLAGALLAGIRTTDDPEAMAAGLAADCTFMLGNRAADLELCGVLSEVVDVLEDPALRPSHRVIRMVARPTQRMLDGAVHIIQPFVNLRGPGRGRDGWLPSELTAGERGGDAAARAADEGQILDAELVEDFRPEELATAFGELFEEMLPEAEAYVKKLRNDHPDDSVDQRKNRAERRFMDLAARKTADTNLGYLELDEAVALHAMTLALLREVPVDDTGKRERQARQLQLAISGYGRLQEFPDNQLIQRGISMAQSSLYAVAFHRLSRDRRFPRLAVVMAMLEKFAPTVNERFIAERALEVINGGALRILAMMVDKAIR
ncbi:hypothetical protein HMPREF0290_1252 [Corynebacterium efficiens YS-314]|uniref:Uncharacterized protein n=1 Tax=Corynebacterium efficiens (strain DSM 44549 / YS-314 / AJ 12310 / JCM 11189 / NBRC 100395) TaxID=196164 RepID=Q8FQB0_COREF|nr:hypothetical protein [Corynebacterium efficiens]EEW50143.1 hypothetical protein HMPREF0290_1252 [Corynebacterium efficiens YS-314]BAC18021.1 hypothetical protein [Corynebacterium efficiens YS-314]